MRTYHWTVLFGFGLQVLGLGFGLGMLAVVLAGTACGAPPPPQSTLPLHLPCEVRKVSPTPPFPGPPTAVLSGYADGRDLTPEDKAINDRLKPPVKRSVVACPVCGSACQCGAACDCSLASWVASCAAVPPAARAAFAAKSQAPRAVARQRAAGPTYNVPTWQQEGVTLYQYGGSEHIVPPGYRHGVDPVPPGVSFNGIMTGPGTYPGMPVPPEWQKVIDQSSQQAQPRREVAAPKTFRIPLTRMECEFDPSHVCARCGQVQLVVARFNGDGTHTHTCANCGHSWRHTNK
jgi:hypothetical protein